MKISRLLFLIACFVLTLNSCSNNSDIFNEIFAEQADDTDDDDTNPLDTDEDGVNDDIETTDGTDPNKPDTDGDGVNDGTEKSDETNPLDICSLIIANQTLATTEEWNNADCDSDGATNQEEITNNSDVLNEDTDGDGVNDGDEATDNTDVLDSCSLILESQNLNPSTEWDNADCDEDGVSNAIELQDNTDIFDEDSDNDGVSDGQEKTDSTNPLEADTDGDGVTDGDEKSDNTDPNDFCSLFIASQTLESSTEWKNADCDSDGTSNIDEVNNGTDPLTEENQASPIAGSWSLTDATIVNGQASTLFQGQIITFPYNARSENENATAVFSENPNIVEGSGEYTNVITFSLFGQDYTDSTVLPSPLNEGNWQIVDDTTLLITGDANSNGSFTILELTENTMRLEIDINREIFAGGINLDATGTLNITFTKG